jgi:hypothetical protein
MERKLVAGTLVAAPLALAASALAAGLSAREPSWWRAAVHLAVLGGIALMIYGVNIRIVPVFARRSWRSPRLLVTQVLAGGLGAWLAFLGIGTRSDSLTAIGEVLALAGGVLFMVNIVGLFKQPSSAEPAPPLRYAQQATVDRIATKFMRLSGTWLVLGLAVGVALVWWRPANGRWDLVWAHMLLIGFFLSMASGVCYHVLARWSDRPWRSVRAIRWHYTLVALGLPFMVLALATDWTALFLVAGPVQAAALALLVANAAPHVRRLRGPARAGMVGAALFLVFGVTLGVIFAIDPATGARLRQAHAVANLFGWAGLLISGFGYALVPGFAGTALRRPRLAAVQIGVLAAGVIAGIAATAWRMYGDGPDTAVIAAQAVVTAGLLLFAAQVASLFAGAPTKPERATVPLSALTTG